jgi:hypothetical protein
MHIKEGQLACIGEVRIRIGNSGISPIGLPIRDSFQEAAKISEDIVEKAL